MAACGLSLPSQHLLKSFFGPVLHIYLAGVHTSGEHALFILLVNSYVGCICLGGLSFMFFDTVSVVSATEPKQKMFCSHISSHLISAAMLLVDIQKT